MYKVIIILLFSLFSSNMANTKGSIVGQPAPDFTLENGKGINIALSKERGKVILLIFGARETASEREKWKKEITDMFFDKNNLFIFAIMSLSKAAPKFLVRRFHRNESDLFDWGGKVTHQYGVSEQNTSNIFLIDKKGIVRQQWTGNLSENNLKLIEEIREILVNE